MDKQIKTLHLSTSSDQNHHLRVLLYGLGALFLIFIAGSIGYILGIHNTASLPEPVVSSPTPINSDSHIPIFQVSISPVSGTSGTVVTIKGTGFKNNESLIHFDTNQKNVFISSSNVIGQAISDDGTTISFKIPKTILVGLKAPNCPAGAECSLMRQAIYDNIKPGTYYIGIETWDDSNHVIARSSIVKFNVSE